MIMSVTKDGINKTRIFLIQSFVYKPLKRGGFASLMAGIFLMASFAIAAPSPLRITIATFAPYYSPKIVHIGTGTPISWENPTADLHSITHDGCKSGKGCAFDSGAIGPNRTFTVQHLPPGYYSYHCSFHPIMRGTLVVLESDSPSET
jgi:plastocyanin